jgi:L-ascorbate metabolism protein UlaG (beta-lactamase superfamily)
MPTINFINPHSFYDIGDTSPRAIIMEITYHGHSWFQIIVDGKNVHFDPLPDSYRKRMGIDHKANLDRKADLIAISHSHGDHWDRDIISFLIGPSTTIVAPKKAAKHIGNGVRVIAADQNIDLNGLSIKAVPAYNIGKIFHRKGKGVGFLMTAGGRTVYHAGDTDLIPEMSSFRNVFLAFLPIGGRFTMRVDEAARATKVISPEVVIPMHWLKTDPSELEKLLSDNVKVKVRVMRPGDTLRFD